MGEKVLIHSPNDTGRPDNLTPMRNGSGGRQPTIAELISQDGFTPVFYCDRGPGAVQHMLFK